LYIGANINMTVAVNTVMVVMATVVYVLHFCQIKNTVRL